MNEPDETQQRLEAWLDELGAQHQPLAAGWDDFESRLPPRAASEEKRDDVISPRRAGKRQRRQTQSGVAAVLLLAFLGALVFWMQPVYVEPVKAELPPLDVRRVSIGVTVFNLDAPVVGALYAADRMPRTGLAMVRDRRLVLHLRKGVNVIAFTDVATTIDPTTVRLTSRTNPAGIQVIEQNFEYDLASGDALLAKSLERHIRCIDKSGAMIASGRLLKFDQESLVLALDPAGQSPSKTAATKTAAQSPAAQKTAAQSPVSGRTVSKQTPAGETPSGNNVMGVGRVRAVSPSPGRRTQLVDRRHLQAIRISSLPSGLRTRPTLVWTVKALDPGEHDMELTYMCSSMEWKANYVAVVRPISPKRDRLELRSWVTVTNHSGTAYPQAGLKLIAGSVNQARDPWIEYPRFAAVRAAAVENFYSADAALGQKLIVQRDFFEYKLYELNQPSSIHGEQIKQLNFFRASGVEADRHYLCTGRAVARAAAEVMLEFKNSDANQLGRALPAGEVALHAKDTDGELILLGRLQMTHTAKNEKLTWRLSRAADVVYSFRQVARESNWLEGRRFFTYEFVIRNHRETEAVVRTLSHVPSDWRLLQSSHRPREALPDRLSFESVIAANSEHKIRYRISVPGE